MPERTPAGKPAPKKSSRRPAKEDAAAAGFTAEERAAMRDRVREQRAERRARAGGARDAGDEGAVLARLAEMAPADRATGERIHAIVMASAPGIAPKLWYGMPAWAKDGKVVCFYQAALKFKTRYATLGFGDAARLDEGSMWPTSFALTELTADDERRIAALVRRAVGA